MHGRVLAVAGSDSGGGAGIQADIKAITAMDAFAMTAITALTAQDTRGVHGIYEVAPEFVERQMRVVLADIGADAVKTGMLHSVAVIEAVRRTLDEMAPAVPRVVDPVMAAKGGDPLLAPDAEQALKELMIAGAALVTPNLPEAEILTGRRLRSVADMKAAGSDLMALGARAVLLKGGHLEGDTLCDVLFTKDGPVVFETPRIATRHTHGTGCTLASAIAAGLAQGMALGAAVDRARTYVFEAIRTAPGYGAGHGPMNHSHPFRAGDPPP